MTTIKEKSNQNIHVIKNTQPGTYFVCYNGIIDHGQPRYLCKQELLITD